MYKSKKPDPYLSLMQSDQTVLQMAQQESNREDRMVENITIRRKFADLNFARHSEQTLQLPSTVDSIRAMILASDVLPIDLRAIRLIDLLRQLRFEQVKFGASKNRNISEEIRIDNCKLEVMSRHRMAEKRLGVAILEQWFQTWMDKFEKPEVSNQLLADMGDVLTYCCIELKRFIDQQCQVRGRLFGTLFRQVNSLYSKVLGEVESFLAHISDYNEEVMKTAHKRVKGQERRLREEIEQLKAKIREKNEHSSELTTIIRHLNVKLGNSVYAQKHIRAEIRQFEEKNQILEKENHLISEIIKKVIQDLRGNSILRKTSLLLKSKSFQPSKSASTTSKVFIWLMISSRQLKKANKREKNSFNSAADLCPKYRSSCLTLAMKLASTRKSRIQPE